MCPAFFEGYRPAVCPGSGSSCWHCALKFYDLHLANTMLYAIDIFPYAKANEKHLVPFVSIMPRSFLECKAFYYPFPRCTPLSGTIFRMPSLDNLGCSIFQGSISTCIHEEEPVASVWLPKKLGVCPIL